MFVYVHVVVRHNQTNFWLWMSILPIHSVLQRLWSVPILSASPSGHVSKHWSRWYMDHGCSCTNHMVYYTVYLTHPHLPPNLVTWETYPTISNVSTVAPESTAEAATEGDPGDGPPPVGWHHRAVPQAALGQKHACSATRSDPKHGDRKSTIYIYYI